MPIAAPISPKRKGTPKGDAPMLDDLELVDGTENEDGEQDDFYEEMEDLYPEEFRLFRMGDNVAYQVGKGYSVVKYDNVAGAKVMAAYAEHGIDMLPVDHEHQTFNAPMNGQTAPAHAWFVPQHRNNEGLYATKVQFTASGKALLAKGPNGEPSQYRFYSPAVELDVDGNVSRLHNAALTNLPALARLKPLMAASQATGESPMTEKEAQELKEAKEAAAKFSAFHDAVLSALGKKTAEEATGALAGLLAARDTADALQARVSALETEAKARETADATALIDASVKEGRIPPAKREEVVSLYGKIGHAGLVSYLSMIPVLKSQEPVKQADPKEGLALLSAAEKEVAKKFGTSAEEYLKTKERVNARRKRQNGEEDAE